MENNFLSLLKQRRINYKTWVPVYCPAIRQYIYFNMRGFNHLRFNTNNTPRNPKEAMYKLGLLPLVRPVIHTSTKVDKYERRLSPIGGTRKKVLKEIEYWGIVGVVGQQNTKIRIVLRKINGGENIHFWSVMKLS